MLIKLCCALIFTVVFSVAVALSPHSIRRIQSWNLLNADGASHAPAIFSLAFRDGNHGLALTPPQLFETADGGETWKEKFTDDGSRTLYSLSFINPTTGWIVGSQHDPDGYRPLILHTDDSGATWQRQSVDVVSQANARTARRLLGVSFCDLENGWAVGSDIILHTANSGRTWETQLDGKVDESLTGIQCVSKDVAWAVGEDGTILKTENGGMNWNQDESDVKDTLLRVRFTGGMGWAVGLNGTLLRKPDSNKKWERRTLNISEALFDIAFTGKQGWIVGANGTILHSDDNGNNWQKENSQTDGDLTSLFFLNSHQGWIGGNRRTVLRLSEASLRNEVELPK